MTAIKNKNKSPNPLNKFTNWMSNFIKMDKTKSTGRKVASSLWALFFGILVAYIYILLSKTIGKNSFPDPIAIIRGIFNSFDSLNRETILKYFLVFGFSSIACALSFKAGLFNIGVPGQMMITGVVNFSIFIRLGYKDKNVVPGHVVLLALLFSIAVAFLVGLIAGVLKAHLNVHEVISTIMLNWIIVGIASLLFKQGSASVVWKHLSQQEIQQYFADAQTGIKDGAIKISDAARRTFIIIGMIALFGLAISVEFIFNHTSLGYKIRMQGISKTNGKYMGVNDKRITIFVLGISAAIAGLAGFYNYIALKTPEFSGVGEPLNLGFEAIAISLLALNSPIGSLFSSLFYTTLYSSTSTLQLDPVYLESYDIQVITSIILYFAALSVMFTQFQPIRYFRRQFSLWSDKRYLANYKLNRLKNKKIKLIAKANIFINKIQLLIDEKNYDSLFKKLENKYKSFVKEINAINMLIAKSQIEVERANSYFELQKKLYIAKKALNVEEITLIKNEIKVHNTETKKLLDKKLEISPLTAELIPLENIELSKDKISNKKKIKLLRKELVQLTNQFLSQAMNYKNTDDQTIEQFELINKEKFRVNGELNALGSTKKFNIKQQKTALIKNNKFEYKEILDFIVFERKQFRMSLREAK
ncbi:Sugar ABC transporter, permease [Metamycoplasma auris 15026]|uniref:Sugar ABC transporter, permease n=1 Tax=Metamycoplasma auris 15026 TaxID=1188233 RepID=N9VBR9_9BACT|nr:ABC transporter permease [Metamycoplasma auris]ENY69123.1 Sugar ABC transporter, permease [Metamycoplasma auris 15026]